MPITPPDWMPTPTNRQLKIANATLDTAVSQLVAARRMGQPSSTPDVLDLLIAARNSDQQPLTEREIRDEIVTFIVAGHETVAAALTWSFAMLAAHPQIQDQLHDEVNDVVTPDALSMHQLSDLPLTRACIDEALRLYPPAWLITRKALSDDELAGARIPAGALIIMSPWLVHRHPGFWTEPHSYMPSRFLEGNVVRHAFIPFGNGLRLCIGRDFAYAEAIAVVARLMSRFELSYPDGKAIPEVHPSVTMRPIGGLHLHVNTRSR